MGTPRHTAHMYTMSKQCPRVELKRERVATPYPPGCAGCRGRRSTSCGEGRHGTGTDECQRTSVSCQLYPVIMRDSHCHLRISSRNKEIKKTSVCLGRLMAKQLICCGCHRRRPCLQLVESPTQPTPPWEQSETYSYSSGPAARADSRTHRSSTHSTSHVASARFDGAFRCTLRFTSRRMRKW
jgi:hypothetical protein